jgi:hypothetical protein
MTSENTRHGRRPATAALCLSVTLLLSVSAWAYDEYPATSYFLNGLSADSSWNEILAKPGIRVVYPDVAFGSTYVPLSSVCIDGDTVAIADPRIDNGVRVPADELRAQAQAATAAQGYTASSGGLVAAAAPVPASSNVALRDPVKVYKVIPRGFWEDQIYLFDKPWPIPTCRSK